MVDRVKGLSEVNRHGHCAVRWQGLIKALNHLLCEGEKGSGGGAVGTETMLCVGKGKGVEFWKE